MKRLAGKRIVITGSSRGIGADIAKQCAREGARVVITYSTGESHAQEVFRSLEGEGHILKQLDILSEESIQKTFDSVISEWGGIEGLVNNAGITRDQLLLRMKTEDFDSVVQTNLRGTFICTRVAAKAMLKARLGSIVHITSVIGQTGNAGQVNYAAAKAGVEALSKSVALELASRNIRSNCIAPGFIVTEMTAKLSEQQKQAILAKIPLQTLGSGADIANATCFLLSDESRYITGHTLNVNGGMLM